MKYLLKVDDDISDWELDDPFEMILPDGMGIDWDQLNTEVEKLQEESKNQTSCNHQWMPYYGLIEAFEFCKLCDEKRNLKDGWFF